MSCFTFEPALLLDSVIPSGAAEMETVRNVGIPILVAVAAAGIGFVIYISVKRGKIRKLQTSALQHFIVCGGRKPSTALKYTSVVLVLEYFHFMRLYTSTPLHSAETPPPPPHLGIYIQA